MNKSEARSAVIGLLALGLLTSVSAISKAQRASGVVRGPGNALDAVTVIVLDSAMHEVGRTASDYRGSYSLKLPDVSYRLRLTKVGFEPVVATLMKPIKDTTIDFVLQPVQVTLDTSRTVASLRLPDPQLVDFERRRVARTSGRFLTDSQLRKNDHVGFSSVIRTHVPRTTLVSYRGQEYLTSSGSRLNRVALNPQDIRSPQGCWVNVYLDGNSLYPGPPAMPPPMNRFTVSEFAGMEYYSGGTAPLEFRNMQNDCGTLLLWTRRR
jgi:hypothetical protein